MIMPVTRETDSQKIARLEQVIRSTAQAVDLLSAYFLLDSNTNRNAEMSKMMIEMSKMMIDMKQRLMEHVE